MNKINYWIPPKAGIKFKSAVDKHSAIAEEYEAQYDILYWKLYDTLTWDHMSSFVLQLKGGHILDAGGGTGRWARRFAQHGFTVDVMDLSDSMLIEGKKLVEQASLAKRITFHHGDICAIPFNDEKYDVIICQGNPINYCNDYKKAVHELARVAKKGAPIIISSHNKLAMIQYFCFFMGKITIDQARQLSDTSEVTIDYPIHALTPDELRDVCRKNGLEILSLVGKQNLSGVVQTQSYLDILVDEEGFHKTVQLEKMYWEDPSIMGMASHIQIACRKMQKIGDLYE